MNSSYSHVSLIFRAGVLFIACLQSVTAQALITNFQTLNVSPSEPTLFDYAVKEASKLEAARRDEKLAYIVAKCAEAGRFEQAMAIAERLPEGWFWLRAEAFAKIAVALWHAGEIQKSEQLLVRVRDLKLPRNESESALLKDKIADTLLEAYLETYQYTRALELARTMSPEHERVGAFEKILGYYVMREKGDLPEKWLDDLLHLDGTLQFKTEREAIAAATTPARRQMEEKALDYSRRQVMRSIIFRVAMAYATKGDFRRAEQLANQVERETDEEGVWHLASRETGQSMLAMEYAMVGKDEDAFRLALSSRGESQARAWFSLAEKFAAKGKHELAEKALAQLLKVAREPYRLLSFVSRSTSAAVIYQQIGQPEKGAQLLRTAFELVKSEKDAGEKANSLAVLAVRAGEFGHHELMSEALAAKKKIVNYDYDYVYVLGSIGMTAARKKQYETVDKIIAEIVKPADVHNGFQKVRALTLIAESWIEVGDKERAAQALRHAVAFKIANADNTRVEDLWRLAVTIAKAESRDLLLEFADSIKAPDRTYFADALADLGLEFARRGWSLDDKQRKTLDRLIASSKEPPRDPPLF